LSGPRVPPDQQVDHERFQRSTREHVLMLCTQGVHQWQITPGLPDTGGQNVFVNHLSQAFADLGYRVTIANRGGYPHPITHELQRGLHYKDAHQRLIYLEDGLEAFVRKEDMESHVHALAQALQEFLQHERDNLYAIISHYWDGARVGQVYNQSRPHLLPHIWVPHSLGMIKKENVSELEWEKLRIDERIGIERELLGSLPAVAATSSRIRASLLEDYGYQGTIPFLPPCVDAKRFKPAEIERDDQIWEFLAGVGGVESAVLQEAMIITEISRTDRTKRKDLLIRALAYVIKEQPQVFLILSVDSRAGQLATELRDLIQELQVERNVIVVGSVWDWLPTIYAITDVYCTPSVMEGFGMSAQEAAACAVPVIASELVPFVSEYLLGTSIEQVDCQGCSRPLRVGEGAIEVAANDVDGFATALKILLRDKELRKRMGQRAYDITIPYFTWSSRTRTFLQQVGLSDGKGE
jgi:glycosyltransferase involved in cell wall biosynthesis